MFLYKTATGRKLPKINRTFKLFTLLVILSVLVLINNLQTLNSGKKKITYLVESMNCKIPNFNPFDSSLSKFFKTPNRTLCSSHPALTEVLYNPRTGEHRLEINSAAVHFYTDGTDLVCCVSTIQPSGANIKVSKCQFFNGSWSMTRDHQFLFVRCSDSGSSPVYENLHATTVRFQKAKQEPSPDKDMNVLLLGFDSMSRLNLHRTMPKTVNHLHARGWTEMTGYNKIGDNTLPNLLSILTGLPLPRSQLEYVSNYFDKYPFIWKDFSSAGYVTAYAEDKPFLETFTGDLPGFKDPPTDYYTRSFFLFGEKYFTDHQIGTECLGLHSPSEHLFKYLLDFVRVYKEDKFFGFFWVNHFSHNDLNKPASEDATTLQLLRQLSALGVMDNTVVIFLSDHGLRVGDLRKSPIGWYEDRLPFLFIALPERYKSRYKSRYSNLRDNANKLVSPYDLHSTMYHVLYKHYWKHPPGCKTCQSLFAPVSSTRTCAEAGISPHWCSCHISKEVKDLQIATFLSNLVIETLNAKLLEYKRVVANWRCKKCVRFTCATLGLAKVLYLRQKAKPAGEEYVVALETDPGGAQFEATVVADRHGLVVDDAMSRLNHFNNQSHCALFPEMKKYCFCVDSYALQTY